MIKDVLTGLNCSIDGRGYAGRVNELMLPKLTQKMMEFNAGGLGATLDVPTGHLEKLESEVTLNGVDPDAIKLFGVTLGNEVPLVFRGATQSDDGSKGAVVVTQRGVIRELDWGTWQVGENNSLKLALTLHYYRYEYDGSTLIEIDPINYKAVINGVDQLAEMRDSLKIG